MDFKKLIARVKGVLLTPRTEWPVIAGEQTTVADLYKGYVLWLAAIPPVFAFVKWSLIGANVPFVGMYRDTIGAGLLQMVVNYVLTLACFYVIALIVDALAPSFGATRDRVQAFKTVAFAYTASAVAGIATILPFIAWLIGIAALIYSVFLIYVGLQHTMKCPPDRAGGYTTVVVIISLLIGLVVFGSVGAVSGFSMFKRGAAYSASHDSGSKAVRKIEQWGKQVEEAASRQDEARKSGDRQAQDDATKSMNGAAPGGGDQVEALAPDRLKSFLPEVLGGLDRATFSAQRNSAMGMQMTEARATYTSEDGRSWDLQITDTGTAKELLALAGWAGIEGENETGSGYDKTYHQDGRLVHEAWDRSSSRGEYGVVLGDRFTVKIEGQAESIDDLKAALADIDLDALEALKGEGVAKH